MSVLTSYDVENKVDELEQELEKAKEVLRTAIKIGGWEPEFREKLKYLEEGCFHLQKYIDVFNGR